MAYIGILGQFPLLTIPEVAVRSLQFIHMYIYIHISIYMYEYKVNIIIF